MEHVSFAYPYLLDGADTRYVPPDVLQWALDSAATFRPTCLDENMQSLAQAHYAAYLLEIRRSSTSMYSSTTTFNSGIVLEKQEGDVRIRYADPRTSGTVTATTSGGTSPYAAWKLLWDRCVVGGGGTDPDGNPIAVRGGIITRYGFT
jgi:hypothetical protein